MSRFFTITIVIISCAVLTACSDRFESNRRMAMWLRQIDSVNNVPENFYNSSLRIRYYDSISRSRRPEVDIEVEYHLADAYLEAGREQEAVSRYTALLNHVSVGKDEDLKRRLMKGLAMAWMRFAERSNCINNHGSQSCIFPVNGNGIHSDSTGSQRAIALYEAVLKEDPSDIESLWLLNIAYMTLGRYPEGVPKQFLLSLPDSTGQHPFKPFYDAAAQTGLNVNNMAGGAVIEDFNNDGHLDIVTSGWGLKETMHYFRNNGDGTFRDIADSAGIGMLTGGLNLVQTDYNNDGYKDILVLRGAWMGSYGKQPNSLLRNNGDDTFTDVTEECGLLTFCPTQAATWADFNNDGWVDLFIGNETTMETFPCEFYLNDGNGHFTEMSAKAGLTFISYVKGVTSGDYNNDGLTDLFISSFDGTKTLFKNTGIRDGIPQFENVSKESGVAKNSAKTFSTWFWDFDNDGWNDIVVCGYKFSSSLSAFFAAELMGIPSPEPNAGKPVLFRNNGDGTFEDISDKVGLKQVAFAMSSGFGDLDNDGWLDFYLGTGNPHFTSLIPNKMFHNIGGKYFEDITTVAQVGNLQKGHEISMADIDCDGDVDIYIEMGGSFEGDAYQSSLFLNPGQNDNHWVKLVLTGTKANKAAIGARVKLYFNDDGTERVVYRDVNTGSSFGSNPLLQHIGLGKADKVTRVDIQWPGSEEVQTISSLQADNTYSITQGEKDAVMLKTNKVDFKDHRGDIITCPPF